jgi:hypothetical protein
MRHMDQYGEWGHWVILTDARHVESECSGLRERLRLVRFSDADPRDHHGPCPLVVDHRSVISRPFCDGAVRRSKFPWVHWEGGHGRFRSVVTPRCHEAQWRSQEQSPRVTV